MALINGYVTLAQFKAAHGITSTDATDDAVIERILQAASRWIDDNSGKTFYPRVEARLYDYTDPYLLELDDDLLSVISITNGDATTLASTEYNLQPANMPPYRRVKIKSSSMYYWTVNSYSDTEQVITVNAFWGFHNRYNQEGWKLATTLNEGSGITASELTFTITSATGLEAGNILEIDNEIVIISSVSSNDITVIERGDNGSTAATHDNLDSVYVWRPMSGAYQAAYDLAVNIYHRLRGDNLSSAAVQAASGVTITPRDVPTYTAQFVRSFWSRL